MRTATILAAFVFFLGLAAHFGFRQAEGSSRSHWADLEEVIAFTQSDSPTRGIGHDWVKCLGGAVAQADRNTTRIECRSWMAQGVTSTLVALRKGDVIVPIVESALADAEEGSGVFLDVVGGTGGDVFQSQRAITPELVERVRRAHGGKLPFALMEQSVYYPLLKRGFTIASVGYWGTRLRTLDEPGEFALGAKDIRLAFDYYTALQEREPALLASSLGTHISLAALHESRIETLDALILVPIMDGLQSHVARALRKIENGEDLEKWANFNIFKRDGDAITFDHSGFHPVHYHVPNYIGSAD